MKIPPRKFGYNDRNISNCLRIQGTKEDVEKSKNENSLAAQKEINKIFGELEVKAEIVNLHRLGSFENFKSSPNKPRVTFVEIKNTWDARLILATAEVKRNDLQKSGIYIRRALTEDEISKENACLRKRRELLNSGVPRENLKIKNFVLYNGNAVVQLK